MARITLPCTAPVLTLLLGLLTLDFGHSTPAHEVDAGVVDLREHLDRRLERFRSELRLSFHREHHRIRRSAPQDQDMVGDIVGQEPLPADKVTVLAQFFVNLKDYIVVGRETALDGLSYQSSAEILRFDLSNYTTIDVFPTSGVVAMEAFLVDGQIYIAVANQRGALGYEALAKIYRFDATTEQVQLVQQVLTMGASDIRSFDFEGDVYLVLTEFRGDGYHKHRTELKVFVFSGAHFDLIASVQTYGATAVTVIEIEWEPYIIVAQYIDNEGQYDIGSIVYKFRTDTDTLVRVQTLPTSAPKDVEAFSMHGEHYLAVANSGEASSNGSLNQITESSIYWWSGLQFVEYQRISTRDASQWEQLPLPNGEVLLILSSEEGVTIYEFGVDAEWEPSDEQVPSLPSGTGRAAVKVVDTASDIFIVVADSLAVAGNYTNGTTNVFQVAPREIPAYVKPVGTVPGCMQQLESGLSDLSSEVDDLHRELEDTLKLDGDQIVTSRMNFTGKVVAAVLTIQNLTVVEDYSFNLDSPVLDDGIRIEDRLRPLVAEKKDVVTISGVQNISSPLLFEQPVVVTTGTVVNTYADKSTINGINVKTLNDSVVWLTGDQTIDGLVTLTENVTLTSSNLDVDGDINGIDIPTDVMTVTGLQYPMGSLSFYDLTTFLDNVTVDGFVNSFNMSADIVTTHLDHVVNGEKDVTQNLVLTQAAVVAEGKTIDTVDLSVFEPQLVPLATGGELSGRITFRGLVRVEGQLLTDLVDGVNVTELDSVAVLIDTRQDILDKKYFDGTVTIGSNVMVVSAINKAMVSTFVRLDMAGGTISTPLYFASTVHLDDSLTLSGFLNEISLPVDVVQIQGEQDISELVSFTQTIGVDGDIEAQTNVQVATYDISELPSRTVSTSSMTRQDIGGPKRFTNNAEVRANITVDELISGVNLTLLQQQILSLTRPQVIDLLAEVRGRLVIQEDLVLVNDTIDGYKLSKDLVKLDGVSTIEGHKTFKELVKIGGDLELGAGINISGVDLPKLNRTVVKLNAVQTIGVEVKIEEDVTVRGNLNIDGRVNGLDISQDAVTLSGTQTVQGYISVEIAVVNADVSTSRLNVSQGVNGVNLDDLYAAAVMQKGQGVTISSPVTFGELGVKGTLAVTGTVDGVDVEEFAANVVTLTGDQVLHGTFEFSSEVDFSQNLTVRQNVSGIAFDSFISSVVLKDTSETIRGQKTFSSNISVSGDVMINTLINGLDIVSVNDSYLSKTIDQELRGGFKTFKGDMSLDTLSLQPGGSVEGITPSTDLVFIKNGWATINGTLWFSDFLAVSGNLVVAETINDVDLLELNNSVVWLAAEEQAITGPWTLEGGVHVIGNITMKEYMTVNGIDISELADILESSVDNQTVQIPAVFKDPVTINGNVTINDLIDGVDIDFLYADAVRSGPSQTISGKKTFAGNATAQVLVVETNMMSMLSSGNASLKHLIDNTVRKSNTQTLSGAAVFTDNVVFQGVVAVTGLVEGIDLSVQAVLNSTDQTLTGENVFEAGLQMLGNVSATGLVDTVDVGELPRIVFLLDRAQEVRGRWRFGGTVTVTGDIVAERNVNGIDVGLTVVTLTGPHVLAGPKTFTGFVGVQGDVLVSFVNGVNLVEFEADIVHLVGDYTITGRKTFLGEVIPQVNVTVTGLVDGIDIQQMYWDHQDTYDFLVREIAGFNDTIRSLCKPIASLQVAVKAQAVQLSHWKEETYLNNSLATYRYDSMAVEGGLLLALTETSQALVDECVGTRLHLCLQEEEGSCPEASNQTLSAASNTELFQFRGDIFIVLALSKQSGACTSQTGTNEEVQVLKMSDTSYDVRLPAGHPIDTAMFVIDDTLFLAVANEYDPITGDTDFPSAVFEYNATTGNFSQLQEVAVTGSTAVAHLHHDGNDWLAFTCTPYTAYSVIMRWNATVHQFVQEASILTEAASDVLGIILDGSPLMIFANEKQLSRHGTLDFNQPIAVYEYTVALGWTLKQELLAIGTTGLAAFQIETLTYLVAVSSRGAIDIYKWSGISHFQSYDSLPLKDVASAHPFVHWGNLYMAIARPAYHSVVTLETRSFIRAIIRGQNEETLLDVLE